MRMQDFESYRVSWDFIMDDEGHIDINHKHLEKEGWERHKGVLGGVDDDDPAVCEVWHRETPDIDQEYLVFLTIYDLSPRFYNFPDLNSLTDFLVYLAPLLSLSRMTRT